MISRLRTLFPSFLTSVLDSYTQIFFSTNRIFALILLIVSFFDFYAGLAGLFSVVVSNIAAYLIGLNRNNIKAGYYGFNSLLTGLALGIYYQPGVVLLVLLIFASLLTLILTVTMEGVIGKYGLPFMSVSFLLATWVLTLASREFYALNLSERDLYMINRMYDLGGLWLVNAYNYLNGLQLHPLITTYFRSLGAIFFQHHLFAGILIAAGLLIYSRIAFLLSWTGMIAAYLYYHFTGADVAGLSYGFIGFNYILTAIAVGGFFLIPSVWSFLWVILLVPVISIIQISSVQLFSLFQLQIYSLPFNLVVLMFLYMLKFRERFYSRPALVSYQQYSPEKNLYSGINYTRRFGKAPLMNFSLPFMGRWKITQGIEGKMTHKGEWKHAWDFEITDEKGSTFSGNGDHHEDYYCFNKPVLAAADGIVEEVMNDIDDNNIGETNIDQNWGNAVVIRHTDLLFSQVCHLKKDSVKVRPGDHLKKGDIIGMCGNSGRSPYPHLHFQFQSAPYIGSKTIDFPFGSYVELLKGTTILHTSGNPLEQQVLSNIEKNDPLVKSFHFIPGQKISFTTGEDETVQWEVVADYLKNTYLTCTKTGSRAYLRYDGNLHYFTHFEGDKKSLLYMFFLGAWKTVTGFYPGLTIKDSFPLNILGRSPLLLIQDFIAPFLVFMKADYSMDYIDMEDHFTHASGKLRSSVRGTVAGKEILFISFEFIISEKGIEGFSVHRKNSVINAKRIW